MPELVPPFEQTALVAHERALGGLRRVEIALTEFCNLTCTYCDVLHNLDGQAKGPIGPELLEQVLEFTERNAGPDGVEVAVTGGEPLSYWPTVTRIVERYQEVLGSRLRALRLASNGTLLRADRAQWLAERGVHVTVGLDGLESAHDVNRFNRQGVGSWKRTVTGLTALVEAGVRPTVSMVVTDATLAQAAAGIDWICETFGPEALEVTAPAPPSLTEPAPRPEPEAWAALVLAAHHRWEGTGTRIEPVATVLAARTTGRPILHTDDGAWGGSITIDMHADAAPSLPLLCARTGVVPLAAADLSAGSFQRWRDRSPAHQAECRACPALGLCGNAPMYSSLAVGGSPTALDPWHCRSQRAVVAGLGSVPDHP